MQIVEKKIGELKPYENNPRKNKDAVEYVANSIREFGWQVPIVIDKDNTIVAGHTRYLAAVELGIDKIPCVVAENLSEQQIKAFRLADNRVGEASSWDWDMLQVEIDSITDIDLSDFNFIIDTDMDIDSFFTETEEDTKSGMESEAKPKKIQCPYCGEWIEL